MACGAGVRWLDGRGLRQRGGGDQYPNGAENWLAGAIPPPGDYFINYFGYYSGDLVDGDGHKVKGGNDVSAWFDALRYVHVSDVKILGGNWGWHVIMPFVYQDLSLGAIPTTSLLWAT